MKGDVQLSIHVPADVDAAIRGPWRRRKPRAWRPAETSGGGTPSGAGAGRGKRSRMKKRYAADTLIRGTVLLSKGGAS